jgi:hypothetical protein
VEGTVLIKRVIFVVLAGLFVAAASAQGRADDSAALLLKHKAFVGWDGSNPAVSSWHMRGTRTHNGATDAYEEFRRGAVFRDRLATPGGVSDEIGFTGAYVWHADENHFWQVVRGREAQAAIEWSLVRAELVNQFPAQLAGQADVRGTHCDVLRVQPKGLVAMDVYEDPQTGAFLRVVVAPGALGQTQFDDITYGGDAGAKTIQSWTQSDGRYTLSDVARSTVATTDLLASPSTAQWTYSDTPSPLTLSALDLNERQILVQASVNGHSGTFLLSTDTPSILLFDPFATQAGVQPLGTSDFSPYVGNVQFEGYGRANSLQLGNAVLRNVVVQKMNAPNSKLAGVLGYDLFAHAVVSVDIAKQTLTIHDPRTYNAPQSQGSYTFQLDLTDRVPAIALQLPSGAVAHPVVDSSLSGFMMLSQALYDSGKIGGHQITNESSVIFSGVGATGDPIATARANMDYTAWNGASTSGACLVMDHIDVGPYAYQNPPVCLGGTNVFGDDSGLVGLDFLRHFNWTVDYPHEQLTLVPNGQ